MKRWNSILAKGRIQGIIEQTNGKIHDPWRVGELLGMNPNTLHKKMKKLAIPLRKLRKVIAQSFDAFARLIRYSFGVEFVYRKKRNGSNRKIACQRLYLSRILGNLHLSPGNIRLALGATRIVNP